jgi:hypothetical protein
MDDMHRAAAIVFALVLAASAAAQTPAAAASSTVPAGWPTAQFATTKDPGVQKALQILDQMILALGGDAWLNVTTMTSEGRAYSFYHGQPNSMSILYWRFWEWPDKDRLELTKQRDVTELLIGDKGYEITYKGTATQDPKELEESLRRREHSLEWVVRKWLPAPGTMILYSGTAMVERNLADQITVLSGNNDSVTLSIDGQTRLPVRVSYSWRDPLDRQFDEASTVFGNYKAVQGVQTPFSVVQYRNDEMSGQRFLTAVTYNTGLAPTLFETKGITYNPGAQKK